MFQIIGNVFSYIWKSHYAGNPNETKNIWGKRNV